MGKEGGCTRPLYRWSSKTFRGWRSILRLALSYVCTILVTIGPSNSFLGAVQWRPGCCFSKDPQYIPGKSQVGDIQLLSGSFNPQRHSPELELVHSIFQWALPHDGKLGSVPSQRKDFIYHFPELLDFPLSSLIEMVTQPEHLACKISEEGTKVVIRKRRIFQIYQRNIK